MSNEKRKKMEFNKYRFFGQKIMNSNTNEVDSYELLLRSCESNQNIFPKNDYIKIINDHKVHQKYMLWLETTLVDILTNNIDTKFSINIDHQELEYIETFQMLKNLKKYSQQLSIEITEVPIMNRSDNYFSSINVGAFENIYSFGFEIAFDDIGQGINSIGNMLLVKDYIYRVKFSTLYFEKKITKDNLRDLILILSKFSKELDKEFVVEGVEDKELGEWLRDNISSLQQGYLYSEPHNIWPIVY